MLVSLAFVICVKPASDTTLQKQENYCYKEYVENLYIARKMVSYPLRLRREAEGMCR